MSSLPYSILSPAVESRLNTIRSQIELYNVQNPEVPYDATTPSRSPMPATCCAEPAELAIGAGLSAQKKRSKDQ